MSFDLTPPEYLALVREEHEDFLKDVGSLRRAMTCCILVNHIVDHVAIYYYPHDTARLCLPPNLTDKQVPGRYRKQIIGECAQAGLIQDVCDFAKHGVRLTRPTVQVKATGRRETFGFHLSPLPIPASQIKKTRDRVVITTVDGAEHNLTTVLDEVLRYWGDKFTRDNL